MFVCAVSSTAIEAMGKAKRKAMTVVGYMDRLLQASVEVADRATNFD